ncbi:MAG: GNAT family N-acetyltransferase [Thermoplasmata archaeon]|nr:GNAT family N-acetyltransferase [Thermoplasmata archaeon]
MIGEKEFWGKGTGTEAVRLLVELGFEKENADAIFGCGVGDYNTRSLKMLRKLGFKEYSNMQVQPEVEGEYTYDLVLARDDYRKIKS